MGWSRSRSRSRDRGRRHSRSPSRSRSRSSSYDDQGYRVHVGDLGIDCSRKEIEKVFDKFGPIHEVWLARNPPCFAFVVYQHKHHAEEAISEMNGSTLCGNRIKCTLALPRTRGRRQRSFDPNLRCYSCGERGHFSRDCNEVWRNRRWGYSRRSFSRSRSRSPRRKSHRSRSRSRDRRRKSRSRSRDRRRSRSRSRDRRRKSRSRSRDRRRSRSRSKDKKRGSSKAKRSRSRSRSKERSRKDSTKSNTSRTEEAESDQARPIEGGDAPMNTTFNGDDQRDDEDDDKVGLVAAYEHDEEPNEEQF